MGTKENFLKHLVDEERSCVLSNLQQLENALKGLQYEGKTSSFHHIRKIEEIVLFLRKKYQQHTNLDDEVVFPFLSKHIPRLYPTLQFLKMERQDFQGLFEPFDKILSQLKEKNRILLRNDFIEQLSNNGLYLICMLRSHIQIEEENVYKAIFQELHQDERNALQKEIEQFLLKENKRILKENTDKKRLKKAPFSWLKKKTHKLLQK
ncbi:MAG: hemerythrin domain-containing protein [Candidatus Omnitrophica bacterium]|nr:hemerythrin domain-containing protein [Candidatus Omnitrophota bacterium]